MGPPLGATTQRPAGADPTRWLTTLTTRAIDTRGIGW